MKTCNIKGSNQKTRNAPRKVNSYLFFAFDLPLKHEAVSFFNLFIMKTAVNKKLDKIIANEPNTLRYEVAIEARNYGNEFKEIQSFFSDLLHHGCVSGFISKLIYYYDTHIFYDKYYNEIEDLRDYYEFQTGEPLKINGDLKNWFAWFAFEETAYQLANELGIDI